MSIDSASAATAVVAPVEDAQPSSPHPSSEAPPTSSESSSAPGSATTKPKSQYYYWHGHEKDRAAVGDVAPKIAPPLLKTEEVSPLTPPHRVTITSYSWCNNEKTVSVYIDFPAVDASMVSVDFQPRRLTVTIKPATASGAVPKEHMLDMWLAKNINAGESSYRVKPGSQVVLKLVKSATETWFDLTGKPESIAEDD